MQGAMSIYIVNGEENLIFRYCKSRNFLIFFSL